MLRLNGCNITEYLDQKAYPHCEQYNLTDIEIQYDASPIPKAPHDKHVWGKIGDCSKFRSLMTSGHGLNGHKFRGCDAYFDRWQKEVEKAGWMETHGNDTKCEE